MGYCNVDSSSDTVLSIAENQAEDARNKLGLTIGTFFVGLIKQMKPGQTNADITRSFAKSLKKLIQSVLGLFENGLADAMGSGKNFSRLKEIKTSEETEYGSDEMNQIIVALFHSYINLKFERTNGVFNITIEFSEYSLKLLMLNDSSLKQMDIDLQSNEKMTEMKQYLNTGGGTQTAAKAIEQPQQAALSWGDLGI